MISEQSVTKKLDQYKRIEYLAVTYACPKCKETEEPQFIKDNGKPVLMSITLKFFVHFSR